MFKRITIICMVAMALSVATAHTQLSQIEKLPELNEKSKPSNSVDLQSQISLKASQSSIESFVRGFINSYLHDIISDKYPCLDNDQIVTDFIEKMLNKFANTYSSKDTYVKNAERIIDAVN